MSLLIVGTLFALVYGPLAVLALRRPFLARLALREAVRRRGQSLLLIGGLMIGSAAITASLVGVDSGRDSLVLGAYHKWGLVDLTVSSGGQNFSPEVAQHLAADPALHSYVRGLQGGIDLIGSVADIDRRLGEPSVLLVGFDPQTQAPFGAYVLQDGSRTFGQQLAPGEVLISHQLADALDARPGDHLRVAVQQGAVPTSAELTVAGIAQPQGPGAYGLRPALFAPMPTASLITGSDQINVVRISATADPGNLDAGRKAVAPLQAAVARMSDARGLSVHAVKAAEVRGQEDSSVFIVAMLLGMSALIVAAGVTLVINLMLTLAEERRPRLALLRAMGLTRRGLVILSVLEGALYSLLAAALGAGAGILAGTVIAGRLAEANALTYPGIDYQFAVSIRPATLAAAFAAGSLITLATVFFAAYRSSRLGIAAAIRDLPEPAGESRRRWPRRVVTAVLGLAGGFSLLEGGSLGWLVGGLLVIVALAMVTRGRLPDGVRATLTGAGLAVWSLIVLSSLTDFSDPNKGMAAFTIAILAAVFGLCVLVAANLRVIERLLRPLGGARLRAALRPPLAYLTRRPLRTGLATGAFAVVLVVVTVLAVFSSGYRPVYARDSAGFDLLVTSTGSGTIELPAAVRDQIVRQVTVPTRLFIGRASFATFGPSGETSFIPLFVLSDEAMANLPLHLIAFDSHFGNADQVWRAMQADPRWIITPFGSPGDRVVLQGAEEAVGFKIAANSEPGLLNGIIGSQAAMQRFNDAPLGVALLVQARPGTDSQALGRAIEQSLFAQGVHATTMRELLDLGYRTNSAWIGMIDVLLRMGLLVGVLSLGVLGVRAVVERRRMIGVLRAIGYRRRDIITGLVAEATITATIGVVVGLGAGAVMGYLFARLFLAGSPFGIDATSVAVALLAVYAAVLLVTVGPAWRVARLSPAEAVRHSE